MPGVLIADDHPNIRLLLRTYVESQGFAVCGEASNGVDAFDKAKELQPDLVLLDLAMPRLNGIEAASIIKRSMPTVRIILFTLNVDSLGKSLASIIGIDFVISKEESMSKLGDHLKRLMPLVRTEGQTNCSAYSESGLRTNHIKHSHELPFGVIETTNSVDPMRKADRCSRSATWTRSSST